MAKDELEVGEKTQRYKMVPVDIETHEKILALCEHYGFNKRGQGALVKKLVKTDYEIVFPGPLPKGKGKKSVSELPKGE